MNTANTPRTPDVSAHFFSGLDDDGTLIAARRRKAQEIVGLLRPFAQGRVIESALSIGSSYCLIEEAIQAELVPQARFICTDLDRNALHRFEQPGLLKRELSAMDLDYPDASFDLIVAHQVLEHINGYPKILQDFRRLTRLGGLIYINVPNPRSPMIGKLPDGRWPKPVLAYLWRHNAKKLRRDSRPTRKPITRVSRSAICGARCPSSACMICARCG